MAGQVWSEIRNAEPVHFEFVKPGVLSLMVTPTTIMLATWANNPKSDSRSASNNLVDSNKMFGGDSRELRG